MINLTIWGTTILSASIRTAKSHAVESRDHQQLLKNLSTSQKTKSNSSLKVDDASISLNEDTKQGNLQTSAVSVVWLSFPSASSSEACCLTKTLGLAPLFPVSSSTVDSGSANRCRTRLKTERRLLHAVLT